MNTEPKTAAELRERYAAAKERLHNPANAKYDPEAPYLWCNRGTKPVLDIRPGDPKLEPTKIDIANSNYRRRIRQEAATARSLGNNPPLFRMYDKRHESLDHYVIGEKVEDLVPVSFHTLEVAVQRKPFEDMAADEVHAFGVETANVIAALYGLKAEAVLSPFKHPKLYRARCALTYELARQTKWDMRPLARLIGTTPESAHHYIHWHCVVNAIPMPPHVKMAARQAVPILMSVIRQALITGRKAEPIDTFPFIRVLNEKGPLGLKQAEIEFAKDKIHASQTVAPRIKRDQRAAMEAKVDGNERVTAQ